MNTELSLNENQQEKPFEKDLFWHQQLSGRSGSSCLLADYTRPAALEYEADSREITFPSWTQEQLLRRSNGSLLSFYAVTLASLKVCLSKYSGSQTIIVGSPALNEPGLSNALVTVDHIDETQTFRQVQEQVYANLQEVYARQDYPFEQLLEDLTWERTANRFPLFDIACLLHPLHGALPELKNDMTIELNAEAGAISGRISFNRRIFSPETIRLFGDHWLFVLQRVLEERDLPIREITLAAQSEQDTMLYTWNAVQSEYPADLCLHQLFEAWVERTPDALALISGDLEVTYAQINARSNQLAHHLHRLGVRAEMPVGLCLERSVDLVVAMFGVLKAGAAYLPLDPAYPQDRLAFLFADSKVSLLLTQQHLLEILPPFAGQVLCLDTDWEEIARENDPGFSTDVRPENLAYIIYTSGTTGYPKGVLLDHRGRVNNLFDLNQRLHVGPTDRLLSLSSLSFDMSVYDICGMLGAGGAVVLPAKAAERDPAHWAHLMVKHQVSIWQSVPVLFEMLVDYSYSHPEATPRDLRVALLGGDWLPVSLASTFLSRGANVQLMNLGGTTEASVHSTLYVIEEVHPFGKSIPYGRPLANQSCYVLGPDFRPVPVGVPGELYLGGIGLARGYFNRADLTAEKFLPHPFALEAGARLYKTGDIARYLADGNLELLGRVDFQAKINGRRIELSEIEAVLLRHPAIQDAVVLAQEFQPGNKRLIAYIVLDDKEMLTVERRPGQANALPEGAVQPEQTGEAAFLSDLRHCIQTQLPGSMAPQWLAILERLPLTANGKIDRQACLSLKPEDADVQETYRAPRNPLEKALVAIWSDAFKPHPVGIEDHFLVLGGHSLLAAQILSRIHDSFQLDLSLQAFFQCPTIAKLAEYIGRVGRESGRDIVEIARQQEQSIGSSLISHIQPRSPSDPLLLSWAQEQLWFLDQLAPGSPFYNVPMKLRLDGPLRVHILEQSLNILLQRHEVLRTTFPAYDGIAQQAIASALTIAIPVLDLQALTGFARRQSIVQQLTSQGADAPFDLSQGPLFHIVLLRLSPHTHILLLTLHHIIFDGWSMRVLWKELHHIYSTLLLEGSSQLAPLPIQYVDFAIWQRRQWGSPRLQEQLAYWVQHLDGVPQLLNLPLDRPRAARQSFLGASLFHPLPSPLSQALRLLGKEYDMSLFMVLLTGFQLFLAYITAQRDVVVGVPFANRTRSELEGLIGFLVNIVVLRSDLSGDPDLQAILKQVRETTMNAYMYQDIPFEKLVEILHPTRSLSYNPLVQVTFQLLKGPVIPPELGELRLRSLPMETSTTRLDLSLNIYDEADDLMIEAIYSTDLFEAESVRWFIRCYQYILEALARKPEQALSALLQAIPEECASYRPVSAKPLGVPLIAAMDPVSLENADQQYFANLSDEEVNVFLEQMLGEEMPDTDLHPSSDEKA